MIRLSPQEYESYALFGIMALTADADQVGPHLLTTAYVNEMVGN